jgi:hypothetical protein
MTNFPGLCSECRHRQTIVSDRGSQFTLCRLALTDNRFPKYPRLPVLQCGGFEAEPAQSAEERERVLRQRLPKK